ncbi:MAG: triose-phosphate isomerase, partial [bacterium]|nr:triose-phosphate isomerase [bacterium]
AKEFKIEPLVCLQSEKTPLPEGVKLAAYEPVFAIGTGNPDTPENAAKVAEAVKGKYGQDLEVLYGGSVTSDNCKPFLQQETLSGLLIGKASLEALEFLKIVDIAGKIV